MKNKKKYISAIIILVSVFFLTGCFNDESEDTNDTDTTESNDTEQETTSDNSDEPDTGSTTDTTTTTDSATKTYTLSEVSQHSSAGDCWMIVSDKVYDVSDYISSHPGGNSMVSGCGIDATSLYDTTGNKGKDHSPNADSQLSGYYIGDYSK